MNSDIQFVESEDIRPLRHKILRKGKEFSTTAYERDKDDKTFHLAAFFENKIVSCATFYPEKSEKIKSNNSYRLRGMATDVKFSRQGYGMKIMKTAFKTLNMNGEKFNSDRAPQAVGLYPHARKVGNLLFLSGVGPRKAGQEKIPGVELDENKNIISYNIETQCHSVFQNIKYILEDAGSSWENIFDVQVFLTNMKDDFKIYNKIYAEYFKENQPCRTTIEIKSLPTPIAIELKVIATI